MKLSPYQIQQGSQAIVVVFCTVIAVVAENRWLALINALGVGFNLAGIAYNFMLERLHRAFRQLAESSREINALNQSLIQDRIFMHFDSKQNQWVQDLAPRIIN